MFILYDAVDSWYASWKSHSWQRVPNPPNLWRPLYVAYLPFSSFVQTLPPPPPLTSLQPQYSFCCLDSLTEYLYYGSTHVKTWSLSTRRNLLYVLCNKVSSLLRSDTWYGFQLVLWFDVIQTHKDTAHPGANRSTHINSVYYIEWIIHWYQKLTFHNVFAF